MGETPIIDPLEAPIIRPGAMGQWSEAMFHIVGHAIDDMHCFADRRDKLEFIDRFDRILATEPRRDPVRRELHPWLRPEASLVAYCILDNHYHVLIRQRTAGGAERVMRSVLRSYVAHFNKKYRRRRAPVFEAPYRVRRIASEAQGRRSLMYVNLNFEADPLHYEYSSHDFYTGKRASSLVDVESGLWFFKGRRDRYQRAIEEEGLPALERKVAARREWGARRVPIRRGRPDHIRRG